MQQEVYKLLQLLLPKKCLQACFCQKLPILVSHKTILWEEIVIFLNRCNKKHWGWSSLSTMLRIYLTQVAGAWRLLIAELDFRNVYRVPLAAPQSWQDPILQLYRLWHTARSANIALCWLDRWKVTVFLHHKSLSNGYDLIVWGR